MMISDSDLKSILGLAIKSLKGSDYNVIKIREIEKAIKNKEQLKIVYFK